MKNMYLRSFLIIALFAISGYGFSQTSTAAQAINNKVNEENSGAVKAAAGTYKFIETKVQEAFLDEKMQEVLIQIEENRHPVDTVYFRITDLTTVKIYPKGE